MSRKTNRREFLKESSLWTTAVAGGALSEIGGPFGETLQAAETKDEAVNQSSIPIVDTHQHLWDLEKFNLPWLANASKDADPINRSFVMSDYFKATKGLNIAKTVYMEVNVHSSQQTLEAEYVIDLCQQDDNPMAGAVIGGSPQDIGFRNYIEKLADNKYVKGVRTVLHDPDRQRGMCLQPQFVDSMKLLGDLGLRFDLCMRAGEISDGARLAGMCPATRFVIDHCGNMSVVSADKKLRQQWKDGMRAAAELDNTVCKISGIVATARKGDWTAADLAPNINFCLETFGADRVFFGGDWPVCTLKATFQQWVAALKSIARDRSLEFQRKLFHDNAVRFYELS